MEAAPTGTGTGTGTAEPKPKPKRKRGADDDVAAPSAAVAAIAEVTDAEVEEFYAILRRASAARRLHSRDYRFSLEDFAPRPPVDVRVAWNGKARRGLDLNAEPEPEPELEAPAAAAAAAPTRTN